MLDMLRKSVGSWVAKGLFGLLILSFGIWGIGDVIRNGGAQKAAITVGDIDISPQTVRQQFERKVSQMRRILGDQLTTDTARKMGMLEASVRELVSMATLDMVARELGIVVSDTAIGNTIAATKVFQNDDGSFDSTRFKSLLAQNGYTEASYVNELRQDLVRSRLVTAISSGVAVPQALAASLFRFSHEQRVGESLTIHANALTVDAEPSEDDLNTLYQDHIATYTAPEYRTLTALLLTQEVAQSRVVVSDQQIAESYNADLEQYKVPERRDVRQVIAADEQTAQAITDKVRAGETLDQAATDVGAPAPLDTGAVRQSDLPGDVAAAVFTLDVGGVSKPVQSPLGWHVFVLKGIEQPRTKTLEDVKNKIAAALRSERVLDKLYDLSATLEDFLGGGATLEEAATQMELPLVRLTSVDADGKDAQGTVVKVLPEGAAGQKILSTGFAQQVDEESRLVEYNDGYVIIRTDGVTPATPRPLDAVRDQVRAQWVAQQQTEKAGTLAQSLLDAVKAGATLESLASAPSVTYALHPAVTREGKVATGENGGPPLTTASIAALFTLKNGDSTTLNSPTGEMILRLDQVIDADPTSPTNAEPFAAVTTSLTRSLGNDLLEEAANAFAQRYGTSVNRAALESTF